MINKIKYKNLIYQNKIQITYKLIFRVNKTPQMMNINKY
jgi:hypothetical protein